MLSGNKGEWAEIYIFLKLLNDGKVYAADKQMNKINGVYLNILKIIREEIENERYEYLTGKPIQIYLNGRDTGEQIDEYTLLLNKSRVWNLLENSARGNSLSDQDVEIFLNSIHINKLSSPANRTSEFFGGTEDITLEVSDYRSGINSVVGFSCKSDFKSSGKATLFNASGDNTNFLYRISGNMTDEKMEIFNNTVDEKGHSRHGDKMKLLKAWNCDLEYIRPCGKHAERNLIISGGRELPLIVANMLKAYFFIGEAKSMNSGINVALDYAIKNDVAKYGCSDLSEIYSHKIGTMLYDMFTGMRLGSKWDGKSSVNGGYIIAKSDGEVLAYHSCIAEEFKQFLAEQLGFEAPSVGRHKYLTIFKEGNDYYMKLNLQIRFKSNSSKPSSTYVFDDKESYSKVAEEQAEYK